MTEEFSGAAIAAQLEMPSVDAVYMAVGRVRRMYREELAAAEPAHTPEAKGD
jgi:hypothetical protein